MAEDIKGGYFDEAAKRGAEFLKNKHADGIENESSRYELWKVQKLLALAKYKQALKQSKVSALVAFRAWAKGKAFAKKLMRKHGSGSQPYSIADTRLQTKAFAAFADSAACTRAPQTRTIRGVVSSNSPTRPRWRPTTRPRFKCSGRRIRA